MGTIDGAALMARSLRQQGVEYMFGIVGFPVFSIATAAQKEGITFIGMRNEQSASYAAQAASYLTGRPQACLVVSGPGVIHAFAGLANAQQNCWPMILVGGASPTYQNGMGAFQEERQVALAEPYCKYAHAVEHVERIPYYVEQAMRSSLYGRPGPVYLDMPDDIIRGTADEERIVSASPVGDPPRSQAHPEDVEAALTALESAERPLIVVGKGMAWSRAEDEVRKFIERTQLPFLASPMGKGMLPDDDPLSVGAARSHALKEADLVFLMGARLNWIMHFGLPPRFAEGVRVIQLDISPEEIGTNVPAEVALVGDGKAVASQLNAALDQRQWFYPADTEWRTALQHKAADNQTSVQSMIDDDSTPMNYYRAYRDIVDWLPDDAIIVGEGANTMDIGRTQMPNRGPRQRLDAGSYGTMGIGLGFMVAAATVHPDRPIVGVQGDSAFGFSGMELETICRYKLPLKLIVLNNGGIGGGIDELPDDRPLPPSMLTPGAHYERVMEAFGGKGFFVTDPGELRAVLDEAMAHDGPALINVLIHPRAGRKPQQFTWLTT
ncbi:MAG: oxalyl-CoA decarboxylase [Pseudomonadales bacterium]|jgi:2-hydroxyacyl-CoA lyase 1|nr:oxalyl-CoA decarboxylase [Pseudomonadales bacterium]MDP6471189.1 oxalyl-CoA decarboxylase [Pseudomonadales bacterium]MDP6825624.1 oxalyl-CoA decarboxylase [Pseudomonadales bacterium]MDP6970461.1 oxalyl-CoA decarboxylase [Pseudomonadales bacterium]